MLIAPPAAETHHRLARPGLADVAHPAPGDEAVLAEQAQRFGQAGPGR